MSLWLVEKKIAPPKNAIFSGLAYVMLLPCALMVSAVRMILGLNSGVTTIVEDGHIVSQGEFPLLSAYIWMTVCLLVVSALLMGFHRVVLSAQAESERRLLDEQIKMQRVYVQEAQVRNRELAAFLHDIDNHLIVLSGLLEENRVPEAKKYAGTLREAASPLRPAVHTGCAAVDVLFGEKMSHAFGEDIAIEISVQLPKDGPPDDMDLCILFSNALDNAIHASQMLPKEDRRIRVDAFLRHTFLVVEVTNSVAADTGAVKYGTGLSNMQAIAQKYGGALQTEQRQGEFVLSVLLQIQGENLSAP